MASRQQLVTAMRRNARILKKCFEDWPEDYDEGTAAFYLEWAAEIIVKYAPQDVPPKKIKRCRKV